MQDDQQVIDVQPEPSQQQQQTTAVARYQEATPALSVDAVRQQVQNIQQILHEVMKVDEHYGKVPGCGDKPTLLQPGAQKIALTFGFAPRYAIEEKQLPNGHREYDVRCSLYHRESGRFVGEGVGVASTMESKYRYRTQKIPTGQPIPGDYQQNKGAYRAQGFACDNRNGEWLWCRVQKADHPDPADNYNTCLKMGKKRAYVDAVLTATAASDLFTQDIEDMDANATASNAPPAQQQRSAPPPQQQTPPPQQQQQQAPPPQQNQQPPQQQQQQQPNPAQQAGQWTIQSTVESVEVKTGQNANGDWTRYVVKAGDGNFYSTFSNSDGQRAQQLQGTGQVVGLQLEQKGKYTNLVGIDAGGAQPQQQATPQQQQPSGGYDPNTQQNVTCTIQQIAMSRTAVDRRTGEEVPVLGIDTDHRDPNVPNDTGRFGVVGDELASQVHELIGQQVFLTYVTDTKGRRVTAIEPSSDIPY